MRKTMTFYPHCLHLLFVFVLFTWISNASAQPVGQLVQAGKWRATVEGESRQRVLEILKPIDGSSHRQSVSARYGWLNESARSVMVTVEYTESIPSLSWITPAGSSVKVELASSTKLEGVFVTSNSSKRITLEVDESARKSVIDRRVHLIYMGGDDCPPCVAWRRFELPKLEKTTAFKAIKFSYVTKSIRSSVPSTFFLPDEVKPLKEKLDIASGNLAGSPKFFLFVNDEIYDHFLPTRDAKTVEAMLDSLLKGAAYPNLPRCIRMQGDGCAKQIRD